MNLKLVVLSAFVGQHQDQCISTSIPVSNERGTVDTNPQNIECYQFLSREKKAIFRNAAK